MAKVGILEEVFKHHTPPDQATIDKYTRIRRAGLEFALVIEKETPNCADRHAALRHVREAVFTANAAVALNGLV